MSLFPTTDGRSSNLRSAEQWDSIARQRTSCLVRYASSKAIKLFCGVKTIDNNKATSLNKEIQNWRKLISNITHDLLRQAKIRCVCARQDFECHAIELQLLYEYTRIGYLYTQLHVRVHYILSYCTNSTNCSRKVLYIYSYIECMQYFIV